MGIREDRWLSERFGRPVFTVEGADEGLPAHMVAQPRASYQAKVPAAHVETVRRLTAAGLYVVDANVTLDRAPEVVPAVDGWEVGAAAPEHEPDVLEIAATAFRYSRFHLDPLVPDEVANRIKRDWAESYFRSTRGSGMLVAVRGGQAVGFLAVLAGEGVRTIDLIAVAGGTRSEGAATALTARFLSDSAGACERVEVGTQLANVPATRLYERLGFTVARTAYVLHGHTGT